jgi:hypothetical protein
LDIVRLQRINLWKEGEVISLITCSLGGGLITSMDVELDAVSTTVSLVMMIIPNFLDL